MTEQTTRTGATAPGRRRTIPILVWIAVALVVGWIVVMLARGMMQDDPTQQGYSQPVRTGDPPATAPMASDAVKGQDAPTQIHKN